MRKTKLFNKIFATALALVLVMSCAIPAFAASAEGERCAKSFGITWKGPVSFSYTDALGTQVSVELGPTSYTIPEEGSSIGGAISKGDFEVLILAAQGQTLPYDDNYKWLDTNYSMRAFGIEPEKRIEMYSNNTYTYQYDDTGNANYLSATGLDAYDARLQPEKKKLVNYVLANGYGNYVPADKEHVAYYYATQLLIYEVVAERRNANFDVLYGGFNPTTCLTAANTAETTISDIQTAYDNMVKWVKLTLSNPAGTSEDASSCPEHAMQFDANLGKYVWNYKFNDIIRQDLTNSEDYAVELSNLNLRDSDIQIYGNNDITYAIDNTNEEIHFYSDEPLDSDVTVGITNPRIRGINESLTTTAEDGLMLIDSPAVYTQAYARGCAKLIQRPACFKLTTADMMKLKINVASDYPEISKDNPCYSLEGIEFGIYSDSECTQLEGVVTTDVNGNAELVSETAQNYWAKETKSPEGYDVNSYVYKFKYNGETEDGYPVYSIKSSLIPKIIYNPLSLTIDNYSNGSISEILRGVQFKVNYYKGFYSQNEIGGLMPERSWVFETDSRGKLYYSEAYLVSGDNLYGYDDFKEYDYDDYGLPLGTITIQQITPYANDVYLINPNNPGAYITTQIKEPINIVLNTPHFQRYFIGDVNCDGYVDVLDSICVLKYAVGKMNLTEEQLYVADVNADGYVDVIDATDIQRYAVGKISHFKKID